MKLEPSRNTLLFVLGLFLAAMLAAPSADADKKKKKKKDKPKQEAPVAETVQQETAGLSAPSAAAREADRHLNAYDTAAAAEALEDAKGDTDAWVATARGRVLEQKKDYDQAAAELRRAADLDPRNPAPVLFLGDTHTYAGQKGNAADAYAQAETRARILLEKNEDDPQGLYFLGVAQQRRGAFAEAAKNLEKARTARPDDSGILFQLGATRFYQERFQEAHDLLTAALEKNSGLAYAYYYRGLAAAKLQRKDLLYNDLDKFVKMAPNAPEAATAQQILASYG